ncbi:hypothetical protein N0V85_009227 [Neurospora sp. IMI 360204]|nr:hypothetical protein N0V85_009227 [Neurospora sp. IMI 360204]
MPVSFEEAQQIPEFLEAAARRRHPHLPAFWQIIMTMQVNLVNPNTNAIRPFAEFTHRRAYDPLYWRFAESAYHWLVFLHRADLTAQGLARIGPTKPGLVEKLRKTLASHEINHVRKRRGAREAHPAGQAYKRIYMTEADFMLGEGAMEFLAYPSGRVLNSQVADIPTSEYDKGRYVDEMVTALKNMVGKDEGMKAQVKQVATTSASVFESLAWRLFIACRQAQIGKPKVSPWATSYYYRKYPNFQARWNDLIHFVSTNKAAVSNLFLSSYFVRFAADPYKERSTKRQNAVTNNDKADKKRAGLQAIATLAGNPPPANANNAAVENAQPEANADQNANQAAQDFVAAAGAAGTQAQGAQEAQGPAFTRPQDVNIVNDGWINYQKNDFEALYEIHEAQVQAYAEDDADAAEDNDDAIEDDNDEVDDGDSEFDDDNANLANHGSDWGDNESEVSDDETRERRRRRNAARAPAAPGALLNQNGLGQAMAGPAMPILSHRPPPAQAGQAPQHHAFHGPVLPAPRRQQVAPWGPIQPPPPPNQPLNFPQGQHGQFHPPGFNQRFQANHQTPSRQPAIPMGFETPAQRNVAAGYGTPARPGSYANRPGPNLQVHPMPQPAQPIQFRCINPAAQVQSPALAGPAFVPRRVITPSSERDRLLRENQQAASATRPVNPAEVMGFPPPVIHNAPVQQAAERQAASHPPQSQPANGQFASSAGPAS